MCASYSGCVFVSKEEGGSCVLEHYIGRLDPIGCSFCFSLGHAHICLYFICSILSSKGQDKDCKLKIGSIPSMLAMLGYFLCSLFLCCVPRNTPPCLDGSSRKKADNDIDNDEDIDNDKDIDIDLENTREEPDDDSKEFDFSKKESPANGETDENKEEREEGG